MLSQSNAFGGFSVDDLDAAREFYGDTLGLDVSEQMGLLFLTFPDGNRVVVYPKDDHEPATYTTLNFPVPNIGETVDRMAEKGIELLRYDGYPHDEKGIVRGQGPVIGWFTDPAGNILSVLEMT